MTDQANELGYDPRPEMTHWRGTPIPPVRHPLSTNPLRESLARTVWWSGPPWTVLRNTPTFLAHVLEYASAHQIATALDDVDAASWHLALDEARPGVISKGAYVLLSMRLGRVQPEDPCDWPARAHRNDVPPLVRHTRDQLYERHRRHRARRALESQSRPQS